MTIDILSMVIGGILWELISLYIHHLQKVIRMHKDKKEHNTSPVNKKNYGGTSIGFTCQLNTEEEA